VLAGRHTRLDRAGPSDPQILTGFDAYAATNHPPVRDLDELSRHLHYHYRDAPILVLSSQPAVPGAVLRPLVEPDAAYPWSMIWRRDLSHSGPRALHSAVDELGAAEHWLDVRADLAARA